jgi:hypothetical protein
MTKFIKKSKRINSLEREKLEAEIHLLKKSWWKQIDNWKSILTIMATTLIALFSFLFSYQTGLFDLNKATLEYRKSALEHEFIILEIKKENIEKEISLFNKEKMIIIDSLNYLKEKIKNKTNEYDTIFHALIKERNSSKLLQKQNLFNYLRTYEINELNKIDSYNNLKRNYNKGLAKTSFSSTIYGYNNALLKQGFNFDIDEIFVNVEYEDFDKIAKIYSTVIANDTLKIAFEIIEPLMISNSTPLVVYIKDNDKIVYSAFFHLKQFNEKQKKDCYKCKDEVILVDLKGLKNKTYKLIFGTFHQGSLIQNKPLFFVKNENIKI